MATRTLPETERETAGREDLAPLYHVIFLDDPFTTMAFVVRILVQLFQKDLQTATRLMLEVHYTGSAIVATLPLEIAELKQAQVHAAARAEGFPFRCRVERA